MSDIVREMELKAELREIERRLVRMLLDMVDEYRFKGVTDPLAVQDDRGNPRWKLIEWERDQLMNVMVALSYEDDDGGVWERTLQAAKA